MRSCRLYAFRGHSELTSADSNIREKRQFIGFSKDKQNREAPKELMVKRARPVTTGSSDAGREKVYSQQSVRGLA